MTAAETGTQPWRREKQRKKTEKNGDVGGFKMRPGRMKKPRRSLSHASAEPKAATGATGRQSKLTVDELSSAVTVHRIYRIATRLISQFTPNFIW